MDRDMGTFMAKKEGRERGWVVVDVKDKTLGRVATAIANILRGKHRPTYTPHVDTGDFVVAINAAHVKLTGKKWQDKIYHSHSGYMGGLKSIPAEKLKEKHPERILIKAVKGMLPKNYLGKRMLRKLKVYSDGNHPHSAQMPKEVNF